MATIATPLSPLKSSMDWLSFATTILPQWRQSLEYHGGIFGLELAENYFDAALNVLPVMPLRLEPLNLAVHGVNDPARINRKLVESEYTTQSIFATTVLTANRTFRAGIIGALEPHQLDAAMALTPTGADYPTPELAIQSMPAQHIIPAILALAISNGRPRIGVLIADLSKPFVCTAADSHDQFVYKFRTTTRVLAANNQPVAPYQLLEYFLAATNSNFKDILRPFYAFAANSNPPDLNAHISAFLSARTEFSTWLELQAHAPTALAVIITPTNPPPSATTSKRPAYCWAHGHGYHTGAACNGRDTIAGFKKEATKSNTMGGSARICEFRPNWKPK